MEAPRNLRYWLLPNQIVNFSSLEYVPHCRRSPLRSCHAAPRGGGRKRKREPFIRRYLTICPAREPAQNAFWPFYSGASDVTLHPSTIHREGHCRSFWKLPKMKRRQRNYYDHFRLYFFYRVSTFRVEFNLFLLNRGHSGKRWEPNFTCLKLCQ